MMLEKLRKNLEEQLKTTKVTFISGNSKKSIWEVEMLNTYSTLEVVANNGIIKEVDIISMKRIEK